MVFLILGFVFSVLGLVFLATYFLVKHFDDAVIKSATENAIKHLPEMKEQPDEFYAKYGYRKILVAKRSVLLSGMLRALNEENEKVSKFYEELKETNFESDEYKSINDKIKAETFRIASIKSSINDYMNTTANLYAIIHSGGKVERLTV